MTTLMGREKMFHSNNTIWKKILAPYRSLYIYQYV